MQKDISAISADVIGCAIAVHRQLGPGLLEKHYEAALCAEFTKRQLKFTQQYPVKVIYDGKEIDKKYRLDLVVDDCIVVELKCVDEFLPVHVQQIKSYMRICNLPHGLLLNFNMPLLKDGIRRVCLPGRRKKSFEQSKPSLKLHFNAWAR